MTRMVQTGLAPDYIALSDELGLDPSKGRDVLNDLLTSGYPGWLDEHDAIVTICPLSNQPNRYKISVDREQKWFGQ